MRIALLAGLLVAGCGGKVVVDPAGAGGATTSTTTTTSTSTSTGTLDGSCKEVCTFLALGGCVPSAVDCATRCRVEPQPSCEAEGTAEIACILSHLPDGPGCVFPACAAEMSAFEACVAGPACGTPSIAAGGQGACDGKAICGGGVELEAVCDDTGFCYCISGMTQVGTCQETGPFLCDFFRGCCSVYWM
jgi:hypothetical protein